MKAIFLGSNPARLETVWPAATRARLGEWVDVPAHILTPETLEDSRDWLAETEAIFSTWGMPRLSEAQLDLMPRLRAVFYAAGSVKYFAAPLFERNIQVVSAWAANAIPVAEFTLSQVIFALKLGWQYRRRFQHLRGPAAWRGLEVPGVHGSTVGVISLGMIGRRVCNLLSNHSLKILAFDPYAPADTFREAGAQPASLEELFANADVVTLHAPNIPETAGMVTGALLESMKENATFINTSRGALVREDELVAVLRRRPDLTAVLDVTHPEPPPAGSPLYELENIVLTPHIAGSVGKEVLRMSEFMIEEFLRWRNGQPLRYAVTHESLARMA